MALTRKFLRALGIEDDKVEEIIGAHLETVNPLKDERDNLKEQADKAAELQKQVDGYSKELREVDEKIQELNWTTELL